MTAKEYLRRCYHLQGLIRAKKEKIAQLRERAVSCNNRLSFEPRAQSGGDRMSAAVAKICDLEVRLALDELRLAELEAEIIGRIDALEVLDYRRLLTLRYVNYKKWEEIALEMHYSYRRIHELHSRALLYFEGLIQ